MHRANTASTPVGSALNTWLLVPCSNRSVLTEHTPGQSRRLSCCPYGSLPGRSRLAFNGEFREPQGWYHLGRGHRLYNPVLRRFNRPDRLSPFGKGGLNAYAYCLGDPVNFSDPTGQFATFWEFLKGVLYERPSANMVLSGSLLGLNILTGVLVPPTTIAAQFALQTGLVGATVGMVGSGMQLAGNVEVGRYVSIIGTIFSGMSVLTKGVLAGQKLRQEWAQIKKDLWPRVKNMFVGGYQPPRALRQSTPLNDMVRYASYRKEVQALPPPTRNASSIPMTSLNEAASMTRSLSSSSSSIRQSVDLSPELLRASSPEQIYGVVF